ncbi:hypothetical protein Bhyg_17386 [Pseudolycoriella hygida]|uniref:Retrovirus-related Pol polyprotein from transposon TNT 1-94-like beta-barrel domain-containing protein n=1 Tax=Pseudolycoriella hygida TaxID=35572 RepID=A0A9Q0RVV5_9DIPT|nr:hypothetical protein Bhyg_17386 [Pseudolycoriella hygida]
MFTNKSPANGEALFSKKNAYKAKSKVKSFKCYSCGGKNHKSFECTKNKIVNNDSKSSEKNCPKVQAEMAKNAFVVNDTKFASESQIKKSRNAFSAVFMSKSDKTLEDEWYIDSGATSHMTPFSKLLYNKTSSKENKILIANNSTMDVEASGSEEKYHRQFAVPRVFNIYETSDSEDSHSNTDDESYDTFSELDDTVQDPNYEPNPSDESFESARLIRQQQIDEYVSYSACSKSIDTEPVSVKEALARIEL